MDLVGIEPTMRAESTRPFRPLSPVCRQVVGYLPLIVSDNLCVDLPGFEPGASRMPTG